ncbi:Conserved_hypothetical protein [Hexamita inflata]|uniref:Uncharacterized protein n=1 Tax=Hexamita inflata TaxID=28002 RepID=A0AA86UBE1_9EUKA|nr:Conserved hypothetical protein [Hexamita inflata]
MLNGKYSEYTQLKVQDLEKYLELGYTGLKLKDEILLQLFGEDYPKQVNDYYNAFTKAKEEKYKAKEEPPTKLEKCQLMHVFKPLPHVDLYIEDNSLYIVDKEMNILKQTPINCEIYSGYNKADLNIKQGYLHQIVPCQGCLYLIINEQVFKLCDQILELVFTITKYDKVISKQEQEMFNIIKMFKDFILNEQSMLYCLENVLHIQQRYSNERYANHVNELIPIKQNTSKYTAIMQFQNVAYSYVNNQENIEIFQLQNNTNLLTLTRSFNILCMCCGIIIIDKEDKKYMIIDLINNKQTEAEGDLDNMLKHLVLGDTGLQLSSAFVRKYCGEGFEEKQLQMYNEMIEQQMQCPCYLEEIRKIIPFELLCKQVNKQYCKS